MRIVVAMSGGVDSSTAAYLLREQGHDVVGVTMCLGMPGAESACCGAAAIADAAAVCRALALPHYVLDFSREMEQWVVAPFIAAYRSGCTPNPCVACNEWLKFGKLFAYAREFSFDAVATGHYARCVCTQAAYGLYQPCDRHKDQTYFLYRLKREQLARFFFPLAEYTKAQVREIALAGRLPVARRPESQDICFVPDGNYVRFLESRCGAMPAGDIISVDGRRIGQHTGLWRYTRGQRHGLGIAAPRPLYVVDIDTVRNCLIVGERPALQSRGLIAGQVNWLIEPPAGVITARAKIRARHPAASCTVAAMPDGRARVEFIRPQEAICPGQAVVWYQADRVCGGGSIQEVIK